MKKTVLVLVLIVLAGTVFAQDFSNYDVYIEELSSTTPPIMTASLQAIFAESSSTTPEEAGVDVESLKKLIPYHLFLLDIGIKYGHIVEEARDMQLRFIQPLKKWIGMED